MRGWVGEEASVCFLPLHVRGYVRVSTGNTREIRELVCCLRLLSLVHQPLHGRL